MQIPSAFAAIEKKRTRLPDWEFRLFTWLSEIRAKPLEFGQFDCAVGLVSGAIIAQTGVDLGLSHIGKYADELQAHRYMHKNGWANLESMMDAFLRPAVKGDRHRGNIVLLESDVGDGFGVRVGSQAVAFSSVGLREFPIPPKSFEWSPL